MVQKPFSRRTYLKVASGSAGLAGLSGCVGDGDDEIGDGTGDGNGDDRSDAVSDANGDEIDDDEVTIYGPTAFAGFTQTFDEISDVQVNMVTAPGYETIARFLAEEERGEHTADVLLFPTFGIVNPDVLPHLAETDVFEEMEEIYPEYVLEEKYEQDLYKDHPYKYGFTHLNHYIFGYSTDRLDEPPTSWEDLLEPRFEDRLIFLAYRDRSMYGILSQEWETDRVEEYLTDLHEHGIRYMSDGDIQAILTGEGDVSFGTFDSLTLTQPLADGAPVGIAVPEFTGAAVSGIGISDNAPNPDAARAFASFVGSREGQESYRDFQGGEQPIHKDLAHGNERAADAVEDIERKHPMLWPPSLLQEYGEGVAGIPFGG